MELSNSKATLFCSLVCACLLAAGCRDRHAAAIEVFSRELTCPAERVSAVERPELPWRRVLEATGSPVHQPVRRATPPPEVAADPGRLALWEQQQSEQEAGRNAIFYNRGTWLVEGCGERRLVGCLDVTTRTNGSRGTTAGVTCDMVDAGVSARVLAGEAAPPLQASHAIGNEGGAPRRPRVSPPRAEGAGARELDRWLRELTRVIKGTCTSPDAPVEVSLGVVVSAGKLVATVAPTGVAGSLLACVNAAIKSLGTKDAPPAADVKARFTVSPR